MNYALSKLIDSNCNLFGVRPEDREKALALFIGLSLAYDLPLPTSPVTDPAGFFADTHIPVINSMLSQVNETQLIPISETKSVIANIWQMRYRMLYQPSPDEIISFVLQHSSALNEPMTKMLAEMRKNDVTAAIVGLGRQICDSCRPK
jgi:hypothetical protein